jgi:urease accessory protein
MNQSCLNATHFSNWQGKLELIYKKTANQTQLVHQKTQSPLKIQRSFYPEGTKVCHNLILHTAGGVVGGDQLNFNIHLQENSHALITTAAASKIYRSQGKLAHQRIQIQVESQACLEWFPQETIVFNGALFQQDFKIELAPNSSWIGWDLIRFGRSARGEKFLEGKWRSHTEVYRQDVPLWIDRQHLIGGTELLTSPYGLAGCSVMGNLVWIGQPVTPEIVQNARKLSSTIPTSQTGITRLPVGLLCRYRGNSTAEARDWFIQIWQLLRQSFLHRPVCIPRVWQLR